MVVQGQTLPTLSPSVDDQQNRKRVPVVSINPSTSGFGVRSESSQVGARHDGREHHVEEDHTESDSGDARLVRYQRREDVEDEVTALPGGTGIAFWGAVASAQEPETIVYGIRRLTRAGDDAGAQRLTDLLIDKVKPTLERLARRQAQIRFNGSLEDRDDIMQAATIQLWHEVKDTSLKEEFWEVNCTAALQRACSDAAVKLRDQREHERLFHRSDDGTWAEELMQPDEAFTGDEFDPFHREMILEEALSFLTGNVRRAAYLRLQGMKEHSKDQVEVTIASVLEVSDRTVRTYLRQAEEQLTAWSRRQS